MCDFRKPPTYRKDKYGIVSPITLKGTIGANRQIAEWGNIPFIGDINEEGLYYVSATGAGYNYFDGKVWTGYDGLIFEKGDNNTCGHTNSFSDFKDIELTKDAEN